METNYTWKEVANSIGISEKELIDTAFKDGLLNKYGFATEYAIKNGLLSVSVEDCNLSTEEKRRHLIYEALSFYRENQNITEQDALEEIEIWLRIGDHEVEELFNAILLQGF